MALGMKLRQIFWIRRETFALRCMPLREAAMKPSIRERQKHHRGLEGPIHNKIHVAESDGWEIDVKTWGRVLLWPVVRVPLNDMHFSDETVS